jgi:hypothetical protein
VGREGSNTEAVDSIDRRTFLNYNDNLINLVLKIREPGVYFKNDPDLAYPQVTGL